MSAHVSIHVAEDVELTERVHVMRSGGARGFLHVDGYVHTVWGSPVALRRFGAAVISVADAAEREVSAPPRVLAARAAA